ISLLDARVTPLGRSKARPVLMSVTFNVPPLKLMVVGDAPEFANATPPVPVGLIAKPPPAPVVNVADNPLGAVINRSTFGAESPESIVIADAPVAVNDAVNESRGEKTILGDRKLTVPLPLTVRAEPSAKVSAAPEFIARNPVVPVELLANTPL